MIGRSLVKTCINEAYTEDQRNKFFQTDLGRKILSTGLKKLLN